LCWYLVLQTCAKFAKQVSSTSLQHKVTAQFVLLTCAANLFCKLVLLTCAADLCC
jgi:hypothetical protein